MSGLPRDPQRRRVSNSTCESNKVERRRIASVPWVPPRGFQEVQWVSTNGSNNVLESILALNTGLKTEAVTAQGRKGGANGLLGLRSSLTSVPHQPDKKSDAVVRPRVRDMVFGVCASDNSTGNLIRQKSTTSSKSIPSVDLFPFLPRVRHDRATHVHNDDKSYVRTHVQKGHINVGSKSVLPGVEMALPASCFGEKERSHCRALKKLKKNFTPVMPGDRNDKDERMAHTAIFCEHAPKGHVVCLNEGGTKPQLPAAICKDAFGGIFEVYPTESGDSTADPTMATSKGVPGKLVNNPWKNSDGEGLQSNPANIMRITTETVTRVVKKVRYLPLGKDFVDMDGEGGVPIDCNLSGNNNTPFVDANTGDSLAMINRETDSNKIVDKNRFNDTRSNKKTNGCYPTESSLSWRQSTSTLPGARGYEVMPPGIPGEASQPHSLTFQRPSSINEKFKAQVQGLHLCARQNHKPDSILTPARQSLEEVESFPQPETSTGDGFRYLLQEHRQLVNINHQKSSVRSSKVGWTKSNRKESPKSHNDSPNITERMPVKQLENVSMSLRLLREESNDLIHDSVPFYEAEQANMTFPKRSASIRSNFSCNTVKQAIAVEHVSGDLEDSGLVKVPNKDGSRCLIVSNAEWDSCMDEEEEEADEEEENDEEYVVRDGDFLFFCPSSPTLTIPARHERVEKLKLVNETDGTESTSSRESNN